jgi:hypothetical protein
MNSSLHVPKPYCMVLMVIVVLKVIYIEYVCYVADIIRSTLYILFNPNNH